MTLRVKFRNRTLDNSIFRLFPGRTWAGMIRLARAKGSNFVDAGVILKDVVTSFQWIPDMSDNEMHRIEASQRVAICQIAFLPCNRPLTVVHHSQRFTNMHKARKSEGPMRCYAEHQSRLTVN